jgi:hypothetical protein
MKRELIIANFNCTFGEKNKPMLEYFDEILYPSFIADIKKVNKKSKDEYFFTNVKLVEYEKDLFALVGFLVKKTVLEIKSGYDANGLFDEDKHIPTAPYSLFAIFLNNHRMILIKNQKKGSPDLRNFSATAKFYLKDFVNKYNKGKKKDERFPRAYLNIASMPSEKTIKEQLKGVKTINKVTLRFYPLNGDVDNSKVLRSLRAELDELQSKSGNKTINTPKNHDGVANLVNDTRGNAIPTVNVTFNDGETRTIRNDEFTEKIRIESTNSNLSIDDTVDLIGEVSSRDEIKEVGEENKIIYLNNYKMIKANWEKGLDE